MGYMGFGMQNWIFKQRPRRPFSKDRKPSGDTINNTEWGDLHIGGLASHNIELAEREKIEFMQRIANRRKKEKIFTGIFLFFIISLLLILMFKKPLQKITSSGQNLAEEQKQLDQDIQAQFILSMNYGIYYFENGEFDLAINEFSHALQFYPDNLDATVGLAKSYLQDCLLNRQNCKNAEASIIKLIEKYPENSEYLSYSISLESSKGEN